MSTTAASSKRDVFLVATCAVLGGVGHGLTARSFEQHQIMIAPSASTLRVYDPRSNRSVEGVRLVGVDGQPLLLLDAAGAPVDDVMFCRPPTGSTRLLK